MNDDTQQTIHYFDTTLRSVPCGATFAQRSTKHVRSVTCPACVAALRARTAPAQASGHADASHAF